MGCKRTVGNHWLEKLLGLVYYYIQPQGRSNPDPTASAFGIVQLWGHGSLAIMKISS